MQEDGNTALHIAAVRSAGAGAGKGKEKHEVVQRMKEIVVLLLAQDNINFDLENNLGFTPLFFAADKGTEDVVRQLLKKGACVTTEVDDEDDDTVKTVEDKIRKRFPRALDEVATSRNRKSNTSAEATLFKLLYTRLL